MFLGVGPLSERVYTRVYVCERVCASVRVCMHLCDAYLPCVSGKWGSIRGPGRMSPYNPEVGNRLAGKESPKTNGGPSETHFIRQQRAYLYIIGDKSQLKVTPPHSCNRHEVIVSSQLAAA